MTLQKITLSLLMLVSFTAHAAPPYAYVANFGLREVDVINTETNSIVTTIPIIPFQRFDSMPVCIAIAPNGKTASVANSVLRSGRPDTFIITASLIDTTLAIPALLSTIQVTIPFTPNTRPTGIAYTTDSNSLYITDLNNNVYSITDITGSQTVATVTTAIPRPTCIAIGDTPNGQTAYIGTFGLGIYYTSVPGNTPVLIPSTSGSIITGITVSPDGHTVYAVSQAGPQSNLYSIDTVSNSVTNTIDLGASSEATGIVISPDGKYLYITDIAQSQIIAIPTNDLNTPTTFASTSPIALAITPDSKSLYVIDNGTTTVSPYLVPAGSSAGTPLVLGGGVDLSSIVITPALRPPSSAHGCKTRNVFLLQTDYINNITWTAPIAGNPAAYAIYRDSALTQLAGIVPASGPLQYYDHDRNPNQTYTYYIVSVDENGNQSLPISITVTQNC